MPNDCILFVEDEEVLREVMRDTFEEEGFNVLIAADGVEALEVMEKRRPDLIVADIMMPRMDGYAFYEAVRSRPGWVTVPFIFLTAKAEPDDVLRGKGLGAEDYVTKPFDVEELLLTIRARLRRSKEIERALHTEVGVLKGQITQVLQDELRTPLTYINNYAYLALDDLPALASPQFRECLRGIKAGVDRLTERLEDLQLVFDIDTGVAREELKEHAYPHEDAGELLSSLIEANQARAAQYGVSISTEIATSLPTVRLCDTYFEDATVRLLTNCLALADPASSEVKVVVRAAAEGLLIEFELPEVTLPAEREREILVQCHTVDFAELDRYGTDLRYYIAYQLYRLHDGELVLRTAPRTGTIFSVRLPLTAG
jgi:CheY-like chemotaxis protein